MDVYQNFIKFLSRNLGSSTLQKNSGGLWWTLVPRAIRKRSFFMFVVASRFGCFLDIVWDNFVLGTYANVWDDSCPGQLEFTSLFSQAFTQRLWEVQRRYFRFPAPMPKHHIPHIPILPTTLEHCKQFALQRCSSYVVLYVLMCSPDEASCVWTVRMRLKFWKTNIYLRLWGRETSVELYRW